MEPVVAKQFQKPRRRTFAWLTAQVQKPWFGTLAWLFAVYLSCFMIDGLAQSSSLNLGIVTFVVVQGVLVILTTYVIVAMGYQAAERTGDSRRSLPWYERAVAARGPLPRYYDRAFLVAHLDISARPPVVSSVNIYSTSARDLTLTGLPVSHVDIYSVESDSFQEALDEMERVAPLYFPWTTPLRKPRRPL